ncbi:MAG: hypothetical protein EA412_03105 [Chitinophagaceae bacterium]|nr:MAG: hypothetical protein EA412_03105 [Chitinophagaceae bacterium]
MKNSKTYALLKSLNKNHHEQLKFNLSSNPRKQLDKLYQIIFDFINSEKTDLEKTEVFKKLYDDKWNKEKDYILRNELRLLNEEIYKVLVVSNVLKEYKLNPKKLDLHLLSELSDILPDIESDIRKALTNAINEKDNSRVFKLKEFLFNYLIDHKEIGAEVYKELHDLTRESRSSLITSFQREWFDLKQKEMFTQRIIKIFESDYETTSSPEFFDHSDTDITDPLANYFLLKSEYYSITNIKNIVKNNDVLIEALKYLEQTKDYYPKYNKEKAICQSNIGLGYFFDSKYEKANEYFSEAISILKKHKLKVNLGIVLNYASSLMKLQSYDEALELLVEYESDIEIHQKLKFRFECLICMAYIFKGEHEKAYDKIPENIQQRPYTEYFYFRFIYIIVFYQRGDIDSSIREILNFRRLIDYHERAEEVVNVTSRLMQKFFNTMVKHLPKEELRPQIEKMKTKIQQSDLKLNPHLKDYLPLTWLKREVEIISQKLS